MPLVDILVIISLSSTLLLHFALLHFLILPRLSKSTRRLVIVLTILEVCFVGLHALTWEWLDDNEFFEWFLNLNHEFALGATFSAVLLMATGVTAFLNGWLRPAQVLSKRGFWLVMGGVFVFLSLDEYYLIHEGIQQTTGNWQLIYASGGIVLLIFIALAYQYGFRGERNLFLLLLVGLGLVGGSGIILDYVTQEIICLRTQFGIGCHKFFVIEEYLEMAGVTILLGAFLTYAEQNLKSIRWQRHQRILRIVTFLFLLWLVGNLWIFPSLEVRVLAQPVAVDYFNNELSLVGYRLSHDRPQPGDKLFITLYWRPNTWLRHDYTQSIHVLAHPEIQSIAQYDTPRNDRYPPEAWIPGLIVREVLPLQIPADIHTPASYWLSLEFWHREERLAVIATDRQQLNDSTIVLDRISVLGDMPDEQPAIQTMYRFVGDFSLYGYDLPDVATVAQQINLSFWWQAESNLDQQLTQFVHFYHVESDSFYTFDRIPFAGRFPTIDWIAGMDVQDDWYITLPEDMPVGEYRVETGLYDSQTIDRIPIHDADDNPVTNNSIVLGILTILQQ